MLRDAVCGRDLNGELYVFQVDYRGETYRFCSMGCRRTFEEGPGRYARGPVSRRIRQLVAFFKSTDRDAGGKCC